MSELVITEKNLLKSQQICDANLLNEILEEVNVVITSQSNFWNVTSFFHTKTEVALIDKINVVSYFIMNGGRVELDSHMHDFVDWQHLWNYMFEHQYISKNEYDYLCGYWVAKTQITKH